MPVKCADCGFLAVRHRGTREITDAEESLRRNGEMPSFTGNRGLLYDEWPICFVLRADFRRETEDNSGTPHRKRVLNEPRECDQFTPWHQGFTPKEHAEMIQQQAMLESQRQLERERAERDREWRKEDIELAKKAMSTTVRSYVIGGVIGFIGALAAVCLARLLK